MTSYIGHQNLFESATVTASNEATGFEKENAYDKRTSTWWKPGVIGTQTLRAVFASNKTVDCFGVFGHNLGTEGATIKLQYSTNSGGVWNDLFTVTPTDDKCIFRRTGTSQSADYWGIEITNCTVDTLIGIGAFGQALALPEGMPPGFKSPAYARNKRFSNFITDGGQFGGRSVIAEGNETTIIQSLVTPSWIDSNWDNLVNRVEVAPFFFSWDYENRPDEAAYCWTKDKNGIKYPYYAQPNFKMFELACHALVE